MLGADAPYIFQLLLHLADSPVNLAAIGLQLGFARSAGADAAAQLRHLHAAPRQPRQQILQLRQLHLQLPFTGARMAGKDIEDQLRAANHPHMHNVFNVSLLRGRKIVIKDDELGPRRTRRGRYFFQLALADDGGRIRLVFRLQELARHLAAGTESQLAQLIQRFLCAENHSRRLRKFLCR